MPIEQIRSLIFHPSNKGQKLVPQLHEVAAWMAVTNPEVLKAVADSDPEALLGAAAASLSSDQRSAVVDSLLRQASAGRALHLQWGRYGSYHKLEHPGLAIQLRPFLTGSQKTAGARQLAITIARACRVQELGTELADIALDAAADKILRRHAAAGAAEVGTEDVRLRLRPLALGEVGDDPDDELKGSGLKALWPELISASDMFDLLTIPKQRNLSGTYFSFFYDRVIPGLKESDWPVALRWFAAQRDRRHVIGPIGSLMDKIIEFAWPHVEEPGVAEAFADALFSRLRMHDALLEGDARKEFYKKVEAEHSRRRDVLNELAPRLSSIDCAALFMTAREFLSPEDCTWYVRRVLANTASPTAEVEAKLARLTLASDDQRAMSAVYEACQTNELFRAECGGIFAPILLDSDFARSLKEEYRQRQEWENPKLLDPAPAELMEKDLRNVEAGRVAGWIDLACHIRLEPTSIRAPIDPLLDLTQAPGWTAANATMRTRIVDAAARYVEAGEPQNELWFETTGIPGNAFAGFQALAVLSVAEPGLLNAVGLASWAKWVPILVRYPFGDPHSVDFQAKLLKRAYEVVPQEVIRRILQAIDFENERGGHLFVAREIEICWDERIQKTLVDKLADPQLKANLFGTILDLVWRHGANSAPEIAQSAIDTSFLDHEAKRTRMMTAAHVLMKHAPDGGWPVLWPLIRNDSQFGTDLIESLSFPDGGDVKIVPKLTEAQLGELYSWLVEHYSYAEQRAGFGFMHPGETAALFRDSVLESLTKRGTFAACDALRAVMQKFPNHMWLAQPLEEAEWLARAATWRPVSIAQLLALASNQEKRLVETGTDLVEVILQSLKRLDVTFREEVPAAKFLWNQSNKIFRPKDEQDLSDYVARHLREDLKKRGIVVNREVQISRGIGDGSGQLTDIHVDAVVPGSPDGTYEGIHVVIEVKGNWHKELFTAMETQLRDRYLKEKLCRDGIYLVGWFACAKWDSADVRKKQAQQISLIDARRALTDQAEKLSTDGYKIESYVLDILLA